MNTEEALSQLVETYRESLQSAEGRLAKLEAQVEEAQRGRVLHQRDRVWASSLSRRGDIAGSLLLYERATDAASVEQMPIALLFKAQELLFHRQILEAGDAVKSASDQLARLKPNKLLYSQLLDKVTKQLEEARDCRD